MSAHAGSEKATMSDERTPLIAVVQTRPHRDRYPHHRLRYVCTLFLSISLFTGLIAAVLVLNFLPLGEDDSDTAAGTSWLVSGKLPEGWPYSRGLDFDGLVDILTQTPDSEKAREYSRYYTAGPHLAGKNLSQALWTKDKWEEFGVRSLVVDYDVYLNYPKGHRLALLEKEGDDEKGTAEGEDRWQIKYEASLEEDVLDEDATSGLEDRVPTFHGYSASGNVTAGYVYVNYGTYQDFEDLQAANVTLEGHIALAKYGGVFRGLKVKRAQEMGMLGIIMYSDPGDDGEVTEANGYAVYPDGPARQPSSVQRGSCQFLSTFFRRTAGCTFCSLSQVSLPATPPPRGIPPNLALHVKTRRTRSPTFRPFPSPTRMPSRCSRPSTATARKAPRSVGKTVVLSTRA
jgi:N-acetylated-alpha-linked acidic dipeptidase